MDFVFKSLDEYLFLLVNPIVWAIFTVAFICYGLLIDLCFIRSRDKLWCYQVKAWTGSLTTMLAALPLLGLLGTISGLFTTFNRMSIYHGFSVEEVVSGGIAQAMFTTQMGLIMVVPGLLLLHFLKSKHREWLAHGN